MSSINIGEIVVMDWYTAEMEIVKGINYKVTTRADNIERARKIIIDNAPEGTKLLNIVKEN